MVTQTEPNEIIQGLFILPDPSHWYNTTQSKVSQKSQVKNVVVTVTNRNLLQKWIQTEHIISP